ncbi:efflux RND transporter periplasmic adaptor subunit [Denitromonas ohlonensis]|uniref:Efflux RND transporter periplasmic adaptor subunit n=2 Tax=Denitromonas TaxID=139331 RepID=A0A557SQJ5_9RHOO|nr:efflux RND transporter periplasmic adaptor subunit [Denitromonas ohlonensis]TVO66792.1 efflux RND transporter periplasmic adaptor subunit [Denitromonas ohlonensis]TVO79662.1 efflux RND transporter periplasmic adaptor subunit [Denitromonas ohlonensis]
MNSPEKLGSPAALAPSAILDVTTQKPRRGRWWLGALVVLLLGAGGYALFAGNGAATAVRYQSSPVERGALVVTVSATGTLQPTNQVNVGSELSGTIEQVFVDDNSRVRKGQVLARLDVSKLEDQVANARAAVKVAEAGVRQAEATVQEAGASLSRLNAVFKLSGGKVPSKTEIETAEATQARAKANLASAQAGVLQAKATLRTNETNLSKASIRSPIDGVVLSRAVEPGQTVAASLQVATLFTLAEDLAKMELQVKVDEADVGQVKEGQRASFTVDAYTDRRYPALITRVSYGATTTDNVVTYLTTLEVANEDLSLRPGMTATAEITTLEKTDVVLVPNAALRYTPSVARGERKQSLISSLMPRPPRQAKTVKLKDPAAGERQLWVLRDGQPAPLMVKTGATNGRVTEIVSGDLAAGAAVITEAVSGAR